jgi:alpha-glutamyl/putrescinyl thymine pyrophosphorylase clade 1
MKTTNGNGNETQQRKRKRSVPTAAAATCKNSVSASAKKSKLTTPKGSSTAKNDLWERLRTDDGKAITMELIQQQQVASTNSTIDIPEDLHPTIPKMVEFYLFMYERQRLYLGYSTPLREFHTYHFCNNYRELDRGTAYLKSQILKLKDDLDDLPTTKPLLSRIDWTEQVLYMAYVYRLCNQLTSFANPQNPVGGIPRLGQFSVAFGRYIQGLRDDGHSFFTNAHQNNGFQKYIQWCRSVLVIVVPVDGQSLLRSVATQIVDANGDMQQVCIALSKLPGIAKFMSWQLACDLQEANCMDSIDDSYVKLGPGAEAGIKDIFGDATAKVLGYNNLHLAVCLRDNLEYGMGLVGKTFPLWRDKPMTLKVIEHALCEFSKFKRMTNGTKFAPRLFRSRASWNATFCQYCHAAKTSSVYSWLCCDTCRAEYCGKCCSDGRCEKTTSSSATRGSTTNAWVLCQRCTSLDGMTFDDD